MEFVLRRLADRKDVGWERFRRPRVVLEWWERMEISSLRS